MFLGYPLLLFFALPLVRAPLVQGARIIRPLPPHPAVSGGDVYSFQVLPGGEEVVYRANLEDGGLGYQRVPIGGGASTPTEVHGQFAPDGNRCVFAVVGVGPHSGSATLYSARTDGSEAPVELYDGSVGAPEAPLLESSIRISPDSGRVVFAAVGVTTIHVLYSVPIDGNSPPTQLSLNSQGAVYGSDCVITPDSSHVVYRAAAGLFRVRLDGTQLPVQLVPSGVQITQFRVAPDSSRAVLLIAEAHRRLYGLLLDGSASPVDLSGPLAPGGNVLEFEIGPGGRRVVFRADALVNDRFELFSAPLDGSSPRIPISGTLVSGGDVESDFKIGAGGRRVVYRADALADERFTLHAAPIDGSAAPVVLCAPLVPGGDVTSFSTSPVGSWVVYRADQEADERFELFSTRSDGAHAPLTLCGSLADTADVQSDFLIAPGGLAVAVRVDRDLDEAYQLFARTIDASGPLVEVSWPLPEGGDVQTGFGFAPDGGHLVYLADQRIDGITELFSSCFSTPSVHLNAELHPGPVSGDVVKFELTPRAHRVVYLADRDRDEVFELYSESIDGPQDFVKLNPGLSGARDVTEFSLTPDGARTIYRANQEADDAVEIYSVPTQGGAAPVKLNGPLVPGGSVSAGASSPDGTRVVYLADGAIFSVPTDGSAAPLELNPPLPAGREVSFFRFAPPSDRVVFQVRDSSIAQLWSVPIDGSLPALLLTAPFAAGGSVQDLRASPDASRVVYHADRDVDEVYELYSVPLDGSAAAIKLNGPLVAGGDVPLDGTGFVRPWWMISPDSSRIAFVADEEQDEVFELFSAPLDGSALPVKLVALGGGRDVKEVRISSDSTRAVYRADKDVDEVYELYSVLLDGSGGSVQLNPLLPPGADVGNLSGRMEFAVSAASNRVVYLVHGSRADLFSVPIDGSQPAIQLNDPASGVRFGGSVLELSPDGRWVAFASDTLVVELFVVPVDGSRPARRSSGPMVSGGGVYLFGGFTSMFSSDSRRVVYPADQETDGVAELFLGSFSAPISRAR